MATVLQGSALKTEPSHDFSANVNQTLSLLTAKFQAEINNAYMTAPATRERANETESQKFSKLKAIEDNHNAIAEDMKILQASKAVGFNCTLVARRLSGFEKLGGSDYLEYDEDEDDDDSDYDSSDAEAEESDDDELDMDDSTLAMSVVDASMRPGSETARRSDEDEEEGDDDDDDDDSDYEDSDSEYDSDESSIGSYEDLMTDMSESMGIDVPPDFLVPPKRCGSSMSLNTLPTVATSGLDDA